MTFSKKRKFKRVCQFCKKNYLAADVKSKTCYRCKESRLCLCGCNKLVKTPGRYFYPNHSKIGKTYKEIYGTKNPNCGFKQGNNYNLLRISPKLDSRLNKPNSKGQMFRSKLEVEFSELLIKNNINFEYEVPFKLINGRSKIVDFVVGDILIEVSGYAYEQWRNTFNDKIKLLRESTDKPILIITYDSNKDVIYNVVTGENVTVETISSVDRIIKTIKFYQWIYLTSKITERAS